MRAEDFLVYLIRLYDSSPRFLSDQLRCLDNLGATAIVESNIEVKRRVVLGRLLTLFDQFDDVV